MNDALPDAGGGYPDGRNVDALEWMIEQGQEAGAPFRDLNKQNYKDYDNLASPQLHDSRYPIVDRVPFTHWGRSTRVVFPGKKLKNMRYLIILFILSIVTGCSSGCSGIQKNKMIVTAKITNASTNVLDWVDIRSK